MKKTVISEQRYRCVMLLSCGEDRLDTAEWVTQIREHEFQLHTFDLGATQKHDAGRFKCLVDQRAGAYHYFASNASITHAFGEFVAGLKTIVAMSVSLKAHAAAQGISTRSVEAGGHHASSHSSEHHEIHIADMHAGEHKNFIVYLHYSTGASASQAIAAATVENVLSVSGKYKLGCSSTVRELQPCLLPGKDVIVSMQSEVAAEVVRSMLVKEVKEIIVNNKEVKHVKEVNKEEFEMIKSTETHEHKTTHEQTTLKEKWTKIHELAVHKEAISTQLVKHMEEDVAKMTVHGGRLHMMAWLSCHWWQRAVTMSHYSYAFRASSTTMTAARGSQAPARWRQLCLWVVGLLFFVLMAILLGRLLYYRRRQPLPAVSPTALDVIQHHTQWPAMKEDLDKMLRGAKDEKITSFFQKKDASSLAINQEIEQYLYMAILYAAVLRASYGGTAVDFSNSLVVRSQAEAYIEGMLEMTKNHVLPSLDVRSPEYMTQAMSQYLYSTIVQAEVLVTIHRPGPVDKDGRIKELEKENDQLKIVIKQLQRCCELANPRCKQQVQGLGGSVAYFEEYVTETTFSIEFESREVKEVAGLVA
ncbi:unnamed protein product [Urochloa humidicola]